MNCEYCEVAERQRGIICSEQEVVAAVVENAAAPGHIIVFPRQHYPILETVPEPILQKCIIIANKVGMAVFDSLGALGTNMVVRNGVGAGQSVPHCAFEIIPRRENDNLPLQWKPLQLMEEEMDTAFLQLKEQVEKGFVMTEPKPEKAPVSREKIAAGKDNYLLKSLRKVP